jgi:hypothetical protein
VIDGIQQYPSDCQTVAQVNNGSGVINVSSSPNYLSQVDEDDEAFSNYQSRCPYTFVAPDDPDSSTLWIEGTGCSHPCMGYSFSDSEYRFMFDYARVLVVAIVITIPPVIVGYWLDPKKQIGFWCIVRRVGFLYF